jgi:hypothetical protein
MKKKNTWKDVLEFAAITLGIGFGCWILSFGFRMLWEIWKNI